MSAAINHRGEMLKTSRNRASNLANALVESEVRKQEAVKKEKHALAAAQAEAKEADKGRKRVHELEKARPNKEGQMSKSFWINYYALRKNEAVGQNELWDQMKLYMEFLERDV